MTHGGARAKGTKFAIRSSLLALQHDGIDVPAIIRLGAVGGAAVAEKALRVGIGAQAEILDMANAGARETKRDITRQIEQGMAIAGGGREKPARGTVLGGEPLDQVGADL